ncbi:MAG: hypothetical protein LC799_19200 [Actinobacteria bacterium]|nr:hypothetical protein [Actinomycetota bacterium]
MDSDPSSAPPPSPPSWVHRSWCAPDCSFPTGGAEGAHLGRAWVLTPSDEQTSRVAVRLVEEPGEDGPGEVEVLLSVTERRLSGDLDPFDDGSGESIGGELADITSSAALNPDEAGRVFEQLVTFARLAREAGGGNRGTRTT